MGPVPPPPPRIECPLLPIKKGSCQYNSDLVVLQKGSGPSWLGGAAVILFKHVQVVLMRRPWPMCMLLPHHAFFHVQTLPLLPVTNGDHFCNLMPFHPCLFFSLLGCNENEAEKQPAVLYLLRVSCRILSDVSVSVWIQRSVSASIQVNLHPSEALAQWRLYRPRRWVKAQSSLRLGVSGWGWNTSHGRRHHQAVSHRLTRDSYQNSPGDRTGFDLVSAEQTKSFCNVETRIHTALVNAITLYYRILSLRKWVLDVHFLQKPDKVLSLLTAAQVLSSSSHHAFQWTRHLVTRNPTSQDAAFLNVLVALPFILLLYQWNVLLYWPPHC